MARELAPAGLRSSPKVVSSHIEVRANFGAASRPSGSKLPRHKRSLGSKGRTGAKKCPALGGAFLWLL
ncbi:hypothetical protein B1219_16175 [Pseudomonas ogarae]|nr:hypothetical protein B1219_16175 [Pseudomonas ogarae]OPG78629.1 hypothetical protein B1218_14595 [Pseudomonas ogarae]